MDDVAHKWTDEQIADLEERVRLAYRSAQIDVQGKGEMPIELSYHG